MKKLLILPLILLILFTSFGSCNLFKKNPSVPAKPKATVRNTETLTEKPTEKPTETPEPVLNFYGPDWPEAKAPQYTFMNVNNSEESPAVQAGLSGGLDVSITNINLENYESLWFCFTNEGYFPQMCFDGAYDQEGETLSLVSFSGNSAQWRGEASVRHGWGNYYNDSVVPLRCTLTLSGDGVSQGFVSIDDLANYKAELKGSPIGAVVPVKADFTVNILFEAYWNRHWQPAQEFFTNLSNHPSDYISTSFNWGFFWSKWE